MTTVSADPLYRRIRVLDISFPVAKEMFFFASLYPADHLLLYFSRAGVVQLSHCPPLSRTRGAVNKQLLVKGAGRTDLGSFLTLL